MSSSMNFLPFRPAVLRPLRPARPHSPARYIALSFAVAITLGTLLLWHPWSHAPGHDITFLQALFTATSAVCVTGLVVVDTGSAWSPAGQIIIMVLIKIGGLGLVTLGTLFAIILGRRIGFSERMRLATQLNALHTGGVVRLILTIFFFSLGLELLGATILYARFASLHGYGEGAFFALFHSISAFNNAGFAFYSDSLMRFAGDPLVSLTIAGLFILGGLGFIVHMNVLVHLRRPRLMPLSLHSKIVLSTSLALIALAFVVVLAFEWTNLRTLGNLPLSERLLNAFFQSVTPRTAGFNTLDYGEMRSATLLFTMLLMFVGASPGSTGGGIKTVPFFLLMGSAWCLFRGRDELVAFGRRVGLRTIVKAGIIVIMAMMIVGAALTVLCLTDGDQPFLALAFEAMSAFGTVGLSMGITPEVSASGQLVLIVLMYLGRIGPLLFALALLEEPQEAHFKYPRESVLMG
jgi:trk system potassium uptake protein